MLPKDVDLKKIKIRNIALFVLMFVGCVLIAIIMENGHGMNLDQPQ